MLTIQGEPLSVSPTILGYIGNFPITNTMVMAAFNFLVFVALCLYVSGFKVYKPSKGQLVFESVFMTIKGLIEQVAGDAKVAWKILPLVSTLVIFILVANLISTVLPILSGFTYEGQSLFRSQTNDLNATAALAVGMVLMTQFYSIGKNNIFGHLGKYFQIVPIFKAIPKGAGAVFLAIINFFVGLLDIISEFAKIISLSLRLFGNMFAGELLIGILMGILAIALPVPIMALATLSGVVQSIVFGSLVASYFTGVLKED